MRFECSVSIVCLGSWRRVEEELGVTDWLQLSLHPGGNGIDNNNGYLCV